MLSRFDDYPIHPTPEPLAQPATTDRNVYDRYFFNGFRTDGSLFFAVALGRYPGRGILDCALSVVRDGVQSCFFASRRAPREPSETVVGPFRLEIIEPMHSLRIVLDDNDTGLAGELVFEPRSANIQEGRQTLRQNGRVIMDATRFAQFGRWLGRLHCGGEDIVVDPAEVYATKDRSWGVRPVGEPETGGAPATALPQFFFTWVPLQWDDRCTHFLSFEDEHGLASHREAMELPAYARADAIPGVEDPALRVLRDPAHAIRWQPGTRRPAAASIAMTESDGRRREIGLEPLLCFRMKGIGYGHAQWGHGRWHDELAIGGETWRCADLDEMAFDNLHVQQVMRAREDGRTGYGVMENFVIGPHHPSGLHGFLDPAT